MYPKDSSSEDPGIPSCHYISYSHCLYALLSSALPPTSSPLGLSSGTTNHPTSTQQTLRLLVIFSATTRGCQQSHIFVIFSVVEILKESAKLLELATTILTTSFYMMLYYV